MSRYKKLQQIKNYLIGDKFSSETFNQSDFGHIFFNQPSEVVHPISTNDLAMALKRLNNRGIPVKIRNTGHSVNGQTLTNGTQVSIGNIRRLQFDKDKLEVTVGTGNTWDEILKKINFPHYCLPVFPNNPGQQIKIGGMAAVGGIGPYSHRYGGLWNHITKIKLVTMRGEIIDCSADENPELLRYSLCGFGRIGVISELTIKVIPSASKVLCAGFFYPSRDKFLQNLESALNASYLDGLIVVHPKIVKHGLVFVREITSKDDVNDWLDKLKDAFHGHAPVFITGNNKDVTDVSLHASTWSKERLVYYYPISNHANQMDMSHPWQDFIIPKDQYLNFTDNAERIIFKNGMKDYLIRQKALHNHLDVSGITSYSLGRLSNGENFFPLSLDLPGKNDSALVAGIFPTVPSQDVDRAILMTKELSDLIYSLGGKRYLYGLHQLTKGQVEQQFGRTVIENWQKLKDELDPKHLLNIDVIEHLDS